MSNLGLLLINRQMIERISAKPVDFFIREKRQNLGKGGRGGERAMTLTMVDGDLEFRPSDHRIDQGHVWRSETE